MWKHPQAIFLKDTDRFKNDASKILLLLSVLVAVGTCLPSPCITMKEWYACGQADWWKNFMKYDTRMSPGAMMCRSGFINIGLETLYKQQISHILNNTQTNLDLRNTTLGYGFHFQCKISLNVSNRNLGHNSGRTLVCAEYGYPKGSPNTNS
jgi:hypothetical protein